MSGRGSSSPHGILRILELFGDRLPTWWTPRSLGLRKRPYRLSLPVSSKMPADSWPVADSFGMPW